MNDRSTYGRPVKVEEKPKHAGSLRGPYVIISESRGKHKKEYTTTMTFLFQNGCDSNMERRRAARAHPPA
ncbi:hypothetical protein EVAR_103175_1, partial [Eumeta japonica]